MPSSKVYPMRKSVTFYVRKEDGSTEEVSTRVLIARQLVLKDKWKGPSEPLATHRATEDKEKKPDEKSCCLVM